MTLTQLCLSGWGGGEAVTCDLGQVDTRTMFTILDKLPAPDVVLASPPCESWSVAPSIPGGNACWITSEYRLAVARPEDRRGTQYNKPADQYLVRRIAGELCAINTVKIIGRYAPRAWAIENPYGSRLWRYLRDYLKFPGHLNRAEYGAYDARFSRKPTGFLTSRPVHLMQGASEFADFPNGYGVRSDIPDALVVDLVDQLATDEGLLYA